MPSKLNAISTGTPSLKFTAAGDGALEIQNDGNTAISIANTGIINVSNNLIVTGNLSVTNRLNLTSNVVITTGSKVSTTDDSQGSLDFNNLLLSSKNLTVGGSINNTENFTKIIVYGFGDNRGFGIVFRPSVTNGTPCWFLNQSGTQVGQITTSASATVYGTTSDYRLKNNIQPMTDGLNKVMLLKPSVWNWSDGNIGQGFIAHELQEIIPSAVVGQKDQVDAEGNPVYQGVDSSFIVATLVKAVQELKQELDAAKSRIQDLENR